MRILVTGGRGLVGRNVLEHPAAQSHEMLAPTSDELDLRDAGAVDFWMRNHRPDMIIHAAGWVGGIMANMNDPARFLLDNLDIGRNVVGAAWRHEVPRLINLGSSCMYPRDYDRPMREDMLLTGPLEPTNEGYAIAKIAVARMCSYISRQEPQFQYRTLMPCNIYGRFDHFDPVRAHLVPAIIRKVHEAKRNGHATVEIWGDGTVRREFMYSGDLADAIMMAVEQFESLPDMMNIGLGFDHSINEYYQAVADALDYRGGFTHDLSKPVGMKRKLLDIGLQLEWGWKASHDLHTGIRRTSDYYLGLAQ